MIILFTTFMEYTIFGLIILNGSSHKQISHMTCNVIYEHVVWESNVLASHSRVSVSIPGDWIQARFFIEEVALKQISLQVSLVCPC
jgi:hypothetical protein